MFAVNLHGVKGINKIELTICLCKIVFLVMSLEAAYAFEELSPLAVPKHATQLAVPKHATQKVAFDYLPPPPVLEKCHIEHELVVGHNAQICLDFLDNIRNLPAPGHHIRSYVHSSYTGIFKRLEPLHSSHFKKERNHPSYDWHYLEKPKAYEKLYRDIYELQNSLSPRYRMRLTKRLTKEELEQKTLEEIGVISGRLRFYTLDINNDKHNETVAQLDDKVLLVVHLDTQTVDKQLSLLLLSDKIPQQMYNTRGIDIIGYSDILLYKGKTYFTRLYSPTNRDSYECQTFTINTIENNQVSTVCQYLDRSYCPENKVPPKSGCSKQR